MLRRARARGRARERRAREPRQPRGGARARAWRVAAGVAAARPGAAGRRTILNVSSQIGSGTPQIELAIAVIVSMKWISPLWSGMSILRMNLSSCARLAAGLRPPSPSG